MGVKTSNTRPIAPTIDIHIEELVLHGFAANDRLHIGAAIEQELSRLVEQQGIKGLRNASVNLKRLDAGTTRLAMNAKPHTIGQHIAQRVYGQLSPVAAQRSQQSSREARSKP